MVNLGSFELNTYEILRREKGRFYVAGSLSSNEELTRLQSAIRLGRVLEFSAFDQTTSVIVGDTSFSTDPVWGHRYELLLLDYVPLGIRRASLSDGDPEGVGERFISPRFRVVASYADGTDELPLTRLLEYDFKIQIGLSTDMETFTLRYEDQRQPPQVRKNFRKWVEKPQLQLEFYLGYLELGDLVLAARGNTEQAKSGVYKSGSWIELEGHGENRVRAQTHYYLLDRSDMVEERFQRMSPGNVSARITTVLIPDIRSGDLVQAQLKDVAQASRLTVKKVEHDLSMERYLTSLEFEPT